MLLGLSGLFGRFRGHGGDPLVSPGLREAVHRACISVHGSVWEVGSPEFRNVVVLVLVVRSPYREVVGSGEGGAASAAAPSVPLGPSGPPGPSGLSEGMLAASGSELRDDSLALSPHAPVHPVSLVLLAHLLVHSVSLLHQLLILLPLLRREVGDDADPPEGGAVLEVPGLVEKLLLVLDGSKSNGHGTGAVLGLVPRAHPVGELEVQLVVEWHVNILEQVFNHLQVGFFPGLSSLDVLVGFRQSKDDDIVLLVVPLS